MSVNEQNLTGRKYRVWDAANNIWKRLSFWTKASDVELNDGTTVESAISTINTNLTAEDDLEFNFTKDTTTGKYGYKDANDNFVPFKTAHTQTKTIDAVGTTDMGEDHEYRYVQTSGLVKPSGTKSISSNGTYDVTNYVSAIVSVSTAKQYVTIQGNQRNQTMTLNHNTSTIFFISSYEYNPYVMTIAVNGTQKTPSLIIKSNSNPNYGLYVYSISGSFKSGDIITLNSTQSANTMTSVAIA